MGWETLINSLETPVLIFQEAQVNFDINVVAGWNNIAVTVEDPGGGS